jgi:hypothetical protein
MCYGYRVLGRTACAAIVLTAGCSGGDGGAGSAATAAASIPRAAPSAVGADYPAPSLPTPPGAPWTRPPEPEQADDELPSPNIQPAPPPAKPDGGTQL